MPYSSAPDGETRETVGAPLPSAEEGLSAEGLCVYHDKGAAVMLACFRRELMARLMYAVNTPNGGTFCASKGQMTWQASLEGITLEKFFFSCSNQPTKN